MQISVGLSTKVARTQRKLVTKQTHQPTTIIKNNMREKKRTKDDMVSSSCGRCQTPASGLPGPPDLHLAFSASLLGATPWPHPPQLYFTAGSTGLLPPRNPSPGSGSSITSLTQAQTD